MTVVQAFASSGNRCDGPLSAPFATLAGGLLARQSINSQRAAGISLDQIRAHQHDLAAWLFSRVRTPTGEAFSRAYAEAVDSILADLGSSKRPGAVAWQPGWPPARLTRTRRWQRKVGTSTAASTCGTQPPGQQSV